MYDHYFSNFGRPPVSRWYVQRYSHKASSVLEKKIFKCFYHIWAWRPSWSMDGNHFSNLSFSCPREAPNEIWTTLDQRLQRRSLLKFATFFPNTCIGKRIWPLRKKVKCQYDHYFSNFGRPPVPDDLCKDLATRHSRFWRITFFKGFYHIWAWSTDRAIFLQSFVPPT